MWKWNFLECSSEITAVQQNTVVSEWVRDCVAEEKCPLISTESCCENLSYYGVEYWEHAEGINLLCPDTVSLTAGWLKQDPLFAVADWRWYLWEQNR